MNGPSQLLTESIHEKEKEITPQAPRAKQNPDAPPQGTPQDWNEIVRQFAEHAKAAGLAIEHKTVVVNDISYIVYRIPNAHECELCGHPNLGTDRCYNPKCARYH